MSKRRRRVIGDTTRGVVKCVNCAGDIYENCNIECEICVEFLCGKCIKGRENCGCDACESYHGECEVCSRFYCGKCIRDKRCHRCFKTSGKYEGHCQGMCDL